MSGRALAILYPGCITFEIALALELLDDTLPVDVAGPAGVPRIESAGFSIEPRLSYGEVRIDDYRAVVVPGGDPESVMRDEALDDLLRRADERGTLLAGICAGVLVLAKAGVLGGRRITHNYTIDYGPLEIVHATERFFAGSEYSREPIVVDGHVITARPEAYVEFAVEIAEGLGVVDGPRADLLRRYYRGIS